MNDPDKPGWYFIFKEVIGDTNFGLLTGTPPANTNVYEGWNDVHWDSFNSDFIEIDVVNNDISVTTPYLDTFNIEWGKSSADMGYITYRTPRIVAYHGHKLLENI